MMRGRRWAHAHVISVKVVKIAVPGLYFITVYLWLWFASRVHRSTHQELDDSQSCQSSDFTHLNSNIGRRTDSATLVGISSDNGTTGTLAFIGIFSREQDVAQRTLIRQTTMVSVGTDTEITVRFVMCAITGSGPYHLLAEEHRQHHDVYILNCTENMNGGKSIHYFKRVVDDFPHYRYYGKADLDTYLVFPQLARALQSAPTHRFYGGRCNAAVQFNAYMSGAAYFLSTDAALALAQCGSECGSVHGPEDLIVAEHLARAMRGQVAVADLGRDHSFMYDRDKDEERYLSPSVVFVHPLKTREEWLRIHERLAGDVERGWQGTRYWNGQCSGRKILEPIV